MDALDFRLLNEFQRDFPRCPQPFAAVAQAVDSDEATVLARLHALKAHGSISRIGGVFAPNRVGASTLAAMAVPPARLGEVAALVNQFPAVNHNYEREHRYNLWFVVTAPDAPRLSDTLAAIETRTGYPLISLPLVEEYHIDLGFNLSGQPGQRAPRKASRPGQPLATTDRCVIAQLQEGLPLVSQPYAQVGQHCGLSESDVLARIDHWLRDGIIKRWGIVVRHHELGYTANAMVVHQVPDSEISALGQRLASEPAITLCYRRPSLGQTWPYNLFCMVHGKDRDAVVAQVADFRQRQGMEHLAWDILFSRTRFKQTGARYA